MTLKKNLSGTPPSKPNPSTPSFSGYSAAEPTESKLNFTFLLKLSNVAEIQEMPSSTKIIPDYNRAS